MTIEFYTKRVYGKPNLYIKDPKIAKTIKILTGKVTVDAYDLAALIALGHTVTESTSGEKVVLPKIETSLAYEKN